jgi:hypothetical protein
MLSLIPRKTNTFRIALIRSLVRVLFQNKGDHTVRGTLLLCGFPSRVSVSRFFDACAEGGYQDSVFRGGGGARGRVNLWTARIKLASDDVVRHHLVGAIVTAYDHADKNRPAN